MVEGISFLSTITIRAHSKKGAHVPDPVHVPRPDELVLDVESTARPMSTPAEIAAFARSSGGAVRVKR